jgi:hypothetical protein
MPNLEHHLFAANKSDNRRIISRKMSDILDDSVITSLPAVYTALFGLGAYFMWRDAQTKLDYAGACAMTSATCYLGAMVTSGLRGIWQRARKKY